MHGRTVLLLGALAAAGPASPDENTVAIVLRLSEQAGAIASSLPAEGADPRVTRVGDASDACVRSALAEARRLLGQEPGARAALREVSLALNVPRAVADRLAAGDASASLLAPYVTPATHGAQVAQPLGDASCGAYYELRGEEGEPGRIALALRLEAGCGCTQPALRVHLMARAALTPAAMEKKNVLRLDAGPARYEVLASCEPCAASAPATSPRVSLPGGPCDDLCAPLAQGLAAWQHKVTGAAARLEELAGQATTLELQLTTDRRELAGAESARSKPRAVLERISALQARIKSAQAELQRVRQASQDAGRVLAALRRVTGDTEGAEGRCRAQCQAQPPQRASAGEGSGGKGGGISTGVLVAGGAALAAGGAVALTAGGSDAATGPTGPPDISGLWSGTKIVISSPGSSTPCRRVFEEDWQISQDGPNLEIAVSSIVTDCGPATCSAGCSEGPPPLLRRHLGSVSGSTAFIYPYPDLQTPACTLPLSIQGSTLRGFMPGCGVGTMDVVLQRVTR